MVGVPGFEPGTSSSRTMRATRLRYTPPEAKLRAASKGAYCIPSGDPGAMFAHTSRTKHVAHCSPVSREKRFSRSPARASSSVSASSAVADGGVLEGHRRRRLLEKDEIHAHHLGPAPQSGKAVHGGLKLVAGGAPQPACDRSTHSSCSRRCASGRHCDAEGPSRLRTPSRRGRRGTAPRAPYRRCRARSRPESPRKPE